MAPSDQLNNIINHALEIFENKFEKIMYKKKIRVKL